MVEVKITDRQLVSKTKEYAKRIFRHESGVLFTILVTLIIVMGALTRGKAVTLTNVSNVLLQSATRGVVAIGEMFVLLTAGIDLSVGGIAILCFMTSANLMKGTEGFPIGPIAVMFMIGIGMGSVNGSLVSRVPMPSVIVTLATWEMLGGLAWLISEGLPVVNLPQALAVIGTGRVGQLPVAAIIFIVVAVVAHLVLNYTTFGRSVYAVGGNPLSAWLSGIKVPNIIFSVYLISGFCAALGGLIIMSRIMSGSMSAGGGLELDAIAAVLIGGISLAGGRGSVLGAVIGVFIIGIINNGMNLLVVKPAFQDIIKALVIIGAVAVDYKRRR
jgi:ribose/xylose/arabinose/galactoside ABC-type transport system permease subunit